MKMMTRQEEIKEGITGIIKAYFPFEHAGCEDGCTAKYLEIENLEQVRQKILSYLHSQGVVIRVEGELPKAGIRGLSDKETEEKIDVWITACEHMILFGYVAVESLIKEGDDAV